MSSGPDPQAIRAMFARVARRYDVLNRLLSLGQDQRWRRKLQQAVRLAPPGPVLDLASGTGDVALGIPQRRVVGADFCLEMLVLAKKKGALAHQPLEWVAADVRALPFREEAFAAVTVAFGWRNFPDPRAAFFSVGRVLTVGGLLAILEFHPVEGAVFRSVHAAWQRLVIEPLGGWLSGDREAYRYLPSSSNSFLTEDALRVLGEEAGFRLLRRQRLGLRVACLSVFQKGGH